MKRVRVAGLVGLAPVAVAFIAPATAHAAPATTRTLIKTVKLPATAAKCSGHTPAAAYSAKDYVSEQFWYDSNSGCIGTVIEGADPPFLSSSITYSMNIYHNHNRVGHQSSFVPQTSPGRHHHAFYVHKRFSTPTQVCVKAFNAAGSEFGAVCTTVP